MRMEPFITCIGKALLPMKALPIICVSILLLHSTVSCAEGTLLNYSHLDHLAEQIRFGDDTVSIIHVYANYPNYEWVDAKESGPEGIACVDDAARAAVLYLRGYELTGDPATLVEAKRLLRFVAKMQADDGQFYNFILADHSINKDGKTSYKSFGWWAARGVWAMGVGYHLMKEVDPVFAELLNSGVRHALPHVKKILEAYGRTKTVGTYKIPGWLLYESAADASSELMLGLSEYYAATNDPEVKTILEKLAEGLLIMQDGDIKSYPYGLHRSWETMWHMWGNGQTQALATAGALLNNNSMIQSAEREAQGFYSRRLIEGFMKEMDVTKPDQKIIFEQIAYAVRPMAVGLLRLYDATGKEEYLTMAGLAASWLFGNNVLGIPMYDPATGRCYDGIRDSSQVNRNSGAESTIESLLTVLEVSQYPDARRFMKYRKVRSASTPRYNYALFLGDAGEELILAIDLQDGRMLLMEGEMAEDFIRNELKE